MLDISSAVDTVYSPFEVACLDAQGREARPARLGPARRPRPRGGPVQRLPVLQVGRTPRHPDDGWGEGVTPDQMVRQARRMVDDYGFTAIRPGWVFEPRHEVETIGALAEAFPDHRLRIDPNGAWTVDTSVQVAKEASTAFSSTSRTRPGIDGMAEVARQTGIPLATNMCVIAFEHWLLPCAPTRCRWSSRTTTCGAGCGGRPCWAASATRSGWDCPCTPTPTSASAWPP